RAAVDGRVLVAGDVPTPAGCVAVPGGESMVDTLLSGVAALAPAEDRLLVATADIPFVTADAIEDVLQHAPRAEFVYTIVPAAICAEALPGMRRTTLRTAEGLFTGGNIVLVDPEFVRRHAAQIREAHARRKDVGRLARLLGPGILLRLLASRAFPACLRIAHLEGAVGRVLGGAQVRAYISNHHGIGSDVDRPEDVALARRFFGEL
ncbi:MAG: hypothetical protein ACKO5K_05115, partial [Armatimonadota bacterium]